MELAVSIGITISEFWEITPYELYIASKAFSKRKDQEIEEYRLKFQNETDLAIMNAWLAANLYRASKMPDLKSLLKYENNEEMTDEEIYQQLLKLANR